jgi:simple sugar transport system ATP-binding protein
MQGLVKRFGDFTASREVDFEVSGGEVHALLGENGAGKTTLMNILYGLVKPDEGVIEVSGKEVDLNGPADAIEAGVGMVHQHPLLVDRLTVAENLFLGGVGNGTARGMTEAIAEVTGRFPLDVDPDTLVEDLPMSQRQRIEIVRCLARGVRVLVLDEPTAVLTVDEVGDLFGEMRLLVEAGHSVIFISHKLSETARIADRVSVLRGGRMVGTWKVAETTSSALAEAMVGEQVVAARRDGKSEPGPSRLILSGCSVQRDDGDNLEAVDLEIREGEIVGIAGVEGNGQRAMAAVTQGMTAPDQGTVTLDDEILPPVRDWRRRKVKLGRIPEDRRREGLTLDATLWENLLTGPQADGTGPVFSRRRTIERARALLEEFGVSPPDPQALAGQLSGGNQQKVIFARELHSDPGVVVAVNPTRGLDLRAQREVHERFLGLRDQGVAVLMISTDLDEVMALSDRIGVLYSGKLDGPHAASEIDRREVGLLMAGLTRQQEFENGAGGLL